MGVPLDVSDNCYLIHNTKGGYFLWDTGIAENVAAMPDGLSQNNGAVVWHRPKTLASQLAAVGVKPEDIKLMAISHMHGDHSGNVDMFPNGKLLIQKAEWDAIFAAPTPAFKADHPAEQLTGDKDVFGDGSMTIISTPGHTLGHQSLLVHLNKTGWVVPSRAMPPTSARPIGMPGDATAGNPDKEEDRVTSMQHIADILAGQKSPALDQPRQAPERRAEARPRVLRLSDASRPHRSARRRGRRIPRRRGRGGLSGS